MKRFRNLNKQKTSNFAWNLKKLQAFGIPFFAFCFDSVLLFFSFLSHQKAGYIHRWRGVLSCGGKRVVLAPSGRFSVVQHIGYVRRFGHSLFPRTLVIFCSLSVDFGFWVIFFCLYQIVAEIDLFFFLVSVRLLCYFEKKKLSVSRRLFT